LFSPISLTEVSFCDSAQPVWLRAGQLAIDYACDVTTIAKKLRNFFARANQCCPAVIRTWILLNSTQVMSVKQEVHLPQMTSVTALNWISMGSNLHNVGVITEQLLVHFNQNFLE
jgi:hypothetical protein